MYLSLMENIINCRTFCEQFSISIHSRPGLSDAEKLVYLRHSLKDGTAKGVIEGLSQSGDCYFEAIESLKHVMIAHGSSTRHMFV